MGREGPADIRQHTGAFFPALFTQCPSKFYFFSEYLYLLESRPREVKKGNSQTCLSIALVFVQSRGDDRVVCTVASWQSCCMPSCRSIRICTVPNFFLFYSELKRRLKAERKIAEKEAKHKEQSEKHPNKPSLATDSEDNIGADEESLDPNVSVATCIILF